jgi:ferredoxin, 2Fe-2S
MPQITVLPHQDLCPDGVVITGKRGQTICEALVKGGIHIEHACEQACACSTCHVIVKEGFNSLNTADDDEEDMLDKAWGVQAQSRLSCQAFIDGEDLTVEIPKYSRNFVKEGHS